MSFLINSYFFSATVVALSSVSLTVSSPVIGVGSLIERVLLEAVSINDSSPVLGTPVFSANGVLAAQSFTDSSPVIGHGTLIQIVLLEAISFDDSSPEIGAPGQFFVLTGSDLIDSSPSISSTSVILVNNPLDGLANLTGAWSFGRKLLSSYSGTLADLVSTTTTLYNQQGTTLRNMAQTSIRNPTLTTGGPNNIPCGLFDGSNDCLIGQSGCALSSLMSASAGYVIISGIFTALTLNDGTNKDRNHRILIDSGDFMGIMGRSGGIAYGFNWDGNGDFATSASSAIAINIPYVFEWFHDSGNVKLSINGGTDLSAASGNTSTVTGVLAIGGLSSGTGAFAGDIFELASFSAVPDSTTRAFLVKSLGNNCGAAV